MFPIINNIDDVLPHIKDKDEFFVAERDEYSVINYRFQHNDTFPSDNPILRECRGLIFDKDGNLIRRPLHKFFNVNEKEETKVENVDWANIRVMKKLDGSMVAPFKIGKHIRWGTKMGITEVSMAAEEFIASRPEYTQFAEFMIEEGITPIFEWCDASNPIVEEHAEDALILVAARNITTGMYVDYASLLVVAQFSYKIPVVPIAETTADLNALIAKTKDLTDSEGFVVENHKTGARFKLKSDWYLALHRTKDDIKSDRHVIGLIIDGRVDDIKPVVGELDLARIRKLEEQFYIAFNRIFKDIVNKFTLFQTAANGDKKVFAVDYVNKLDSHNKSILYSIWDKRGSVEEIIYRHIKSYLGSNEDYEVIKKEFLCIE